MQLKNKWYDYVFSAFGAAALLAATVFLAARWPMIAQQIPSHYDLFGQVDAWSGKGSLIVLLIVGWVIFALLCALNLVPKIWNIPETTSDSQKENVYRLSKTLLLYVRCLVGVLFSYLVFQSALVRTLPGWFLPVVFICMMGGVLYFLARIFSASGIFK